MMTIISVSIFQWNPSFQRKRGIINSACRLVLGIPDGEGAPGGAVMTAGTFMCWGVATAELVVNKWALYTAFVAVPEWTVPSVLAMIVVWAEVSSLPAGLRVCCETSFQGPSVRWDAMGGKKTNNTD